ncbi:MAG: hypothetical protein GY797_26420 [Deltaproteobacteria bacterium]|nr:hypothetical protein [Deltaproteobacteria bacterium]
MSIKYVKPADLAKELEMYPSQISQLITRGLLNKNKDGLLNFEKSKNIIEDRKVLNKKGKTRTLTEITIEREEVKLKMDKIELAKREGEVVERKEVAETNAKIFTIFKTRILGIPVKTSPELVGQTNIKKIHSIQDKANREALRELAKLKKV